MYKNKINQVIVKAVYVLLLVNLLVSNIGSGVVNAKAIQIEPPDRIYVSDMSSLITAINQANSNGPGLDVIDLANGVYSLTTADNGINAFPIINSALAIYGNGATLTRTNGALAFRFFYISSQGTLGLYDLTLSGGDATGKGGAIYNDSGTLTIIGSTISNNKADSNGGGIYSSGGNVDITDSSLLSNEDRGEFGGAIFVEAGNLNISGSTLSGNHAFSRGGAIHASFLSTTTIVNSILSDNSSGGNTSAVWGGNLIIQHSTIAGNHHPWPNASVITTASLIFEDNILYKNSGGISNYMSAGGVLSSRIVNNCIVANMVDDSGAVVRTYEPGLNATNNYWGAADGPSGAGPGSGDPVSAGVDFTPFLTTLPAGCPSDPTIAGVVVTANPAYNIPAYPDNYHGAPSKQFVLSAQVIGSGDFDPSVTWSIVSGGGSLASTTAVTTDFTTPASVGTTVIRATSVGDPAIYKDISFETMELTITCYRIRASVPPNGTVPFSCGASFGGEDWNVINGGGTIDFNDRPQYPNWATYATYTAPGLPGAAVVRISAKADPGIYFDIPVQIDNSGSYTCNNYIFPAVNTLGNSYSVSTGGMQSNYANISRISFDIFDPLIGEYQTITVNASVMDPGTDPIQSITVTMNTDKGVSKVLPLTLISGVDTNGTWQGSYQATDTHCNVYSPYFEAVNNTHPWTGALTLRSRDNIGEPTFVDVPLDHPRYAYIEALRVAGYTAGCAIAPLRFCPEQTMTRAESAVFMLRGNFGSGYTPPAAPWNTFADDWAPGDWALKWAEGMWMGGLTAGCQSPANNPVKLFCPWELFPRVQASVFGLRMKYGMNYTPPPATGTLLGDMTDVNFYGTKWAEQAYLDGLLPSCGTQNGKPKFCPDDLVDRSWGAYLIVKAKNLPLP